MNKILNEEGQLHCTDGPAYEDLNGSREWYRNGERHREDGPAIELTDGSKGWFIYGKLHRIYGPAIEYADGDKDWYINGHRLTDMPKTEEDWVLAILKYS